jgi:hypothetical protein
LPIFGSKIGVFLKNQCCDQIFAKTCSILSNKRQLISQKIGEIFFKNHSIGPWLVYII